MPAIGTFGRTFATWSGTGRDHVHQLPSRPSDLADRHRRVLTSAICQECHNAEGPKKAVKTYVVHSSLCEY